MTALAVILVAYRSGATLPATLAALRSQLAATDEVVVVDNDGSAGACEGATVIDAGVNLGFAAGCHRGAAATRAPLLLFLNPDVRLAPDALERLRSAAGDHPRWAAWQPLVLLPPGDRINTQGGVVHWSGIAWSGRCGAPAATAPRAPGEVAFASGAALVIRRTAWEAVGGFEPSYFLYHEDVDLGLRLRLAGHGVGVIPAARVEHDYAFARNPQKLFLLERNRWRTVLGAYPPAVLAAVLPALLALELALIVAAAHGGWLRAKLRAQAAVLGELPSILARRRRAQRARAISAAAFARVLSAELDSPYLGAAGRNAPVVALQRAYWRAALALIARS